MFTYRRILMVTVGLLGLAFAFPDPPIAIVRPKHFISSQETVRWEVRIKPHEDNRLLVFQAFDRADGNEVSHSEEQLNGAQAPKTRWFDRRLPVGSLLVVAALYGLHNRHDTAKVEVCVYSVLQPCGADSEP